MTQDYFTVRQREIKTRCTVIEQLMKPHQKKEDQTYVQEAAQEVTTTSSKIKKRLSKIAKSIGLGVALTILPISLETIIQTTPVQAQTKDQYVMDQVVSGLESTHSGIFNDQYFRFINDDIFKVNTYGSVWIEQKRGPKLKDVHPNIQKAYDIALFYLRTNQHTPDALSLLMYVASYESNGKGGLENLDPLKRYIDVNTIMNNTSRIRPEMDEEIIAMCNRHPERAEENAVLAYEYAARGGGPVEEHIKKALATKTTNEDVYTLIGNIFWKRKELERAKTVYQKGVEVLPKSERLHKSLAVVYLDLGNKKDSLKEYEKANGINPKQEYLDAIEELKK